MSANLIARLIEAGTPAALVADVAMELGKAEAERAILAERRENERNRKARSREVTGQHVTARDGADTSDSPPLSPPSPKDPQTPKEPQPPHTPPRTPAAHARRLPIDWQPEPLTGVAGEVVTTWQAGRLERELSMFRDHWAGASGATARKHDWQATWRKWVVRADEQGPKNGHQRPEQSLRGSRPDPAVDLWRQAQADAAAEGADENSQPDSGTGLALPSYLTGRS